MGEEGQRARERGREIKPSIKFAITIVISSHLSCSFVSTYFSKLYLGRRSKESRPQSRGAQALNPRLPP